MAHAGAHCAPLQRCIKLPYIRFGVNPFSKGLQGSGQSPDLQVAGFGQSPPHHNAISKRGTMFNLQTDTIAAISTPIGSGGIAIVRVSGSLAKDIAGRIFMPFGKSPEPLRHRMMTFGHVVDQNGMQIDEALAVIFTAPNSYTKEDMLEIHCHGGSEMARQTLAACLSAGARMAEPGEFTMRAFLSGRIDLSQAEAVMRVISAKSGKAAAVSQKQLSGALSKKVIALQDELLDILAAIEAAADYPEDDIGDETAILTSRKIASLISQLDEMLNSAKYARALSDGIRICIAGKPNAGKSSLMNALLGENRAIVTDIAGTTRDVLTEPLNIHGIPTTLCDTAGLRTDGDVIERIGIERAREEIDACDIVLLVWDVGEELSDEDWRIIALNSPEKPVILVKNKADLLGGRDAPAPTGCEIPSITISALHQQGIEDLKTAISQIFQGSDSLGAVNLTEERHVEAVSAAKTSLGLALDAIEGGMPVDICAIDLQDAWRHLGLITGKAVTEELISRIFEKFCLGK